ncbi:hypothetical protein N752_01035 [Desulforamulus aquiferis]|nr:hypothetical protein [Desulforamulus aquiferis]RYD07199.1 hypothetical protein N752_01035 [Desulforamulus aquiferis]
MIIDYLMEIAFWGGIAAVAWYLFKPQKQKAETTQDLVSYKKIYPDGIVELDDLKMRLVIEIEPINMALRSQQEQVAIWSNFRGLMNTMQIPFTMLVMSTYLSMKDYTDGLKAINHRPQIAQFRDILVNYYNEKAEGKVIRDRRFYIILKIDARAAGVASGVEIENPILDKLISSLPKVSKSTMDDEELRYIAIDELNETSAIIQGALEGMGIMSRQLNYAQVVDMIYQIYNRDIANIARVKEADESEAFSLFVRSLTPQMFSEKAG